MRIEKRIPVAAGMGGGSADAAGALRLAMAITGPTQPRPEELDAIAAGLGADVPGQLAPGLSVGTGAGELVEPRPALAPHAFVVVPSEHRLATPAVFREADRLGLPRAEPAPAERHRALGAALGPGGRRLPYGLLVNDLEPAAISLCPSVAGTLVAVRAAGAEVALVCGSGPTVAGLWWGEDAAERADRAVVALRREHGRAIAATPVTPEFAAVAAG